MYNKAVKAREIKSSKEIRQQFKDQIFFVTIHIPYIKLLYYLILRLIMDKQTDFRCILSEVPIFHEAFRLNNSANFINSSVNGMFYLDKTVFMTSLQ